MGSPVGVRVPPAASSSQARRGGPVPGPIPTSHAGSLPRPEDLVELNLSGTEGQPVDEADYQRRLADAVKDVVAKQSQIGIDLVNDGEYGHAMGHRYDYGSWWTYVFQRLGGLELVQARTLLEDAAAEAEAGRDRARRPSPSAATGTSSRRPTAIRPQAWRCPRRRRSRRCAAGPITYDGHDAVQRDIDELQGRDGRRGPGGRLPELGRPRQLPRASATSSTRTTRR